MLNTSWSVLYRELGHITTEESTSSAVADKAYHITVLVSVNMTVGRFHAFAAHIYVRGDIPRAKYDSFSSTFTVIKRGSKEKKVVDASTAIMTCRVPSRAR